MGTTLECNCFDTTKEVYGMYRARFVVKDDSCLLEITTTNHSMFEKGKTYKVTVEEISSGEKQPTQI